MRMTTSLQTLGLWLAFCLLTCLTGWLTVLAILPFPGQERRSGLMAYLSIVAALAAVAVMRAAP